MTFSVVSDERYETRTSADNTYLALDNSGYHWRKILSTVLKYNTLLTPPKNVDLKKIGRQLRETGRPQVH